jgi:hypothetical protein
LRADFSFVQGRRERKVLGVGEDFRHWFRSESALENSGAGRRKVRGVKEMRGGCATCETSSLSLGSLSVSENGGGECEKSELETHDESTDGNSRSSD